jgi:hypothetical protein
MSERPELFDRIAGDKTPPNHHQLDAWHTALSGALALLRSVEP